MGEIRVKVLLSNVVDEKLALRGDLDPAKVRRHEVDAVIDTGAVTSTMPPQIADDLGLVSDSRTMAELANGENVAVDIVDPVRFEIMGRRTTDEALILGNEVLIGQTVLEKLDLLADCARQRLVPNPAHPDQPVRKIK
ncbi:MAG: clan AA aspartic protease [Planctomycetaceae bacterium]|nr:clan AA aspartic protease [Planctomycetaceae bacterium]